MIPREKGLKDGIGREVDYLRLSVTDRCNLNCIYCLPLKKVTLFKHDEILRFEEIERVISIFAKLGVSKVRITGGEPLLRRNLIQLLHMIKKIPGINNLSITTNGVLLEDIFNDLLHVGIDGINISLDTLNKIKYKEITGFDYMPKVLRGIENVLESGFNPLKINVVIMGGINDEEVEDFVNLTKEEPIEVRFIEYMPMIKPERPIGFISAKSIISRINYPLDSVKTDDSNTAKLFEIPGFKGKIGFISPISHKFCSKCNRIRLTAGGLLRTCLINNHSVDLKGPLRTGYPDSRIKGLIKKALSEKQGFYDLENLEHGNIMMSSIGG